MPRHNPFALRSFVFRIQTVEVWHAAAAKSKISLSQFLRQALRTAAHEVLARNDEQPEQTKAELKQQAAVTVTPMKRNRREANRSA